MKLVEPIPINPSRDIPRMLRAMADRIEAGEEAYTSLTVVGETFDEDGEFDIEVFGWGADYNKRETIGILTQGITVLL